MTQLIKAMKYSILWILGSRSLVFLYMSFQELWSAVTFRSFSLFISFALRMADMGSELTNTLSIFDMKHRVAYDFMIIFRLGSFVNVNSKAMRLKIGLTSCIDDSRMLMSLPLPCVFGSLDLLR